MWKFCVLVWIGVFCRILAQQMVCEAENTVNFLGKCFCAPGFVGQDCSEKLQMALDCSCSSLEISTSDGFRCFQLCHWSNDVGIAVTTQHMWTSVQREEVEYWEKEVSAQGTDNDRNAEHAEGFGQFVSLGDVKNFGSILEVGAGPFTQTLNVLRHVQNASVRQVTLLEPNIYHYMNLSTCSYASGQLLDYPTVLIAGGMEQIEFAASFDTIININVIEHVSNAFTFLTNMYNALKPGGTLIFHERWHNVPDAMCLLGPYTLHPIRLQQPILNHFLSLFDILYISTAPTAKMKLRMEFCQQEEHAFYVIARKRFYEHGK